MAVLDEKLSELRKALVELATLVEQMISSSINGLVKRNRELLHSVIQTNQKPMTWTYGLMNCARRSLPGTSPWPGT
jgi:hypothetical protein